MIKAIIGIGVALVWITFFALAKAAGTADRRLEEIQRLCFVHIAEEFIAKVKLAVLHYLC